MGRESRLSSQRSSAAPATPATMDQPAQVLDDSRRNRPASRLKRMSDATVRRLSRPLSMISGRSSSASRQQTPSKLQKSSARNSIASRTSRPERPPSSRRSSLLSTGASFSTHGEGKEEEEEDLGDLPVFGVSQRAYLASLMSLFANGNGAPCPANSPLTDPSSVSSSLGPYEYAIHSAAIYKYPRSRRLYVGWPGLVRPPPEALLEFEMETLPLLERDLQGISGHLGQQGIRVTYELRMSGYAAAGADTVSLSPTVWILYRAYASVGAQVSVAELHQVVADIFYLQKGLEIQEGGGRIELSSDRGLVNVKLEDKESIKLSDGSKLSVHIEDCQTKYSVCGALCCVTTERDAKQVQGLSRIGGLIKVNGKYILGVSTAHAMLDGSGIFSGSFDETSRSYLPAGQAVDRDVILSESSRVSKWHNVTCDAAVDFLGISMNSRGEMAINRSQPENATDFALLRLRKLPGFVRNKYIPPRAAEAVSITSTASASAAATDEGSVCILCGGGAVAEGQLIWGSASFVVRGRNFRVRRIQTSQPLNAGTTGSWVVRGEVLYGVIIAVYENEPFALMMTVERLFASILGSAFSIRSVELWDGEIPAALMAHENGESSNKAKDVVPARTRRRAQTDTHDNRNGEGSSRDVRQVNGDGVRGRPGTTSEGTQSLSPRAQISNDGSQTEEQHPPNGDSEDLRRRVSSKPVRGSSATRATRPKGQGRPVSHTSDMTMSGAMQDLPPASKGKQRSDTGGCGSAGAQTAYSPASETLHRQDSGFDSETSPPPTDGVTHEQRRRGLQAPSQRPAIEIKTVKSRGGSSLGADSNMNSAGTSNMSPQISTGPKSRENSLQGVFGNLFRRTWSKGQSPDDEDQNHGISPTGLGGRRPLFKRRRSSAIDSKPSWRNSNHGNPPTGLDSRPLSSLLRRSPAKVPGAKQSSKDSVVGSSCSGGGGRPLSFLRRGFKVASTA